MMIIPSRRTDSSEAPSTVELSGQSGNAGVVTAVRGSVVDVRFASRLPSIRNILLTGQDERIVIEVMSHLDQEHVRGIALTPTQGLARGMAARDTDGPLMAPVGPGLLSRMFDVFGNALDQLGEIRDVSLRSIHNPPPALSRRSTTTEVFETGIKVIDVLLPLERGGCL